MPGTANSIITPQTPRSSTGVCTIANSTYSDTPTNTVVIFTAGGSGSRVTRITAVGRATVTATELQLYRDGNGSGTAKRLFNSKAMAAYTVAQTTGNTPTDFGYSDDYPMILASGEILYAAIGVSNAGVVFSVEGADY
ncbi:MAG: hypothetical protein ACHP9T_10670 [Caulobacterales bacterium]|jgi:hypothetical protein